MGVNDFINVGERIKNLRKERGIQQKEMAALLKIPVSTYSNYENGYREPSKEIIEKIADKLDVLPENLLGWDDVAKVTTDENGNTIIDLTYKRHIKQITRAFDILNVRGREEVLAFASDLAQMSRYTKPQDSFTKKEYIEMYPELFDEKSADSPKLDTPTNNQNEE